MFVKICLNISHKQQRKNVEKKIEENNLKIFII